jgi:pimeloyl-ACP methyl ester carboxylesterase
MARDRTERPAGEVTEATLSVPGASIYYEVRGSGPVLLMIPGGPTDAGVFMALAELLADRYTTVTYDPRGNSRSTLDGPPADVPVEVHADDARRLLAAIGGRPASVLGSSGGAVIGLDVVVRHPEVVNTYVAHEPPVHELLAEGAQWRDMLRDVDEVRRTDGAVAAMQRFAEAVDDGGPTSSEAQPLGQTTPEQAEMLGRVVGNFEFFLAHVMRELGTYVPDVDRLRRCSTRVVVGAGQDSGEQRAYRAAAALAEQLGQELVHFPGAHTGYASHAQAFAAKLHQVLAGDTPHGGEVDNMQ